MPESDLAPHAHSPRPVELSIVIPAYNEALRIGQSLKRIDAYFADKEVEILVVDDGSTDDTVEMVKGLGLERVKIISYEANQGKGYAVQQGVLQSKGDKVLITDADLSTPIEYFDKLEEELGENPLVIGSRGMKDSDVSNQILRVWLGKTGNKLIQFILPGIKDTQCGFKLFEGETARNIFQKQLLKGFGFDFEILFIAQRQNLSIREVPVKWVNALGSKVKPRHYLTTLVELGTVVINHWRGRYK